MHLAALSRLFTGKRKILPESLPLVCLITPNHICTNPRLVKEAKALSAAGYQVHLIFTQESRSSAAADQIILAAHPQWSYTKLDWTGEDFLSKWRRLQSGITQRLAKAITKRQLSPFWCFWVVNRNYRWQLKSARKVEANLYIAHNLGALAVAKNVAEKQQAVAGFDAEDFHRQETENDLSSWSVRVKTCVEDSCLQKGLTYFTAASPLIGAAYTQIYPGLQPRVLLNVFPTVNSAPTANTSDPLQLFWFSQTVGPNRGVEAVLEALAIANIHSFCFHVVGNVYPSFQTTLQSLCHQHHLDFDQLKFYGTVPEDEIFAIASQCDVGLATETGYPYNRAICLTNKIFTYIQSGLAVVASDTPAQEGLLQEYSQIGRLYQRDRQHGLAEVLQLFDSNRDLLNGCKTASFDLGQTRFNWEEESKAFIEGVRAVISKNSLSNANRQESLSAV